jgi:hypothetical protein
MGSEKPARTWRTFFRVPGGVNPETSGASWAKTEEPRKSRLRTRTTSVRRMAGTFLQQELSARNADHVKLVLACDAKCLIFLLRFNKM